MALARTPPPRPRPAFTMALERQRSVCEREGRSAGVGSWALGRDEMAEEWSAVEGEGVGMGGVQVGVDGEERRSG